MTLPDKEAKISSEKRTLLEKARQDETHSPDNTRRVDRGDVAKIENDPDLIELLYRKGVPSVEDGEASMGVSDPKTNISWFYSTNLDELATDDTIGMYLNEMAVVPLLSMEEEIDLSKRIERAATARRELALGNGFGDADRQRELEFLIRDGFFARDYLIKANTRLVVSIARRYIGQGVPFLDLIQEGNLGLMRAVEKFEYRRGYRFSTYATWWIRQSITRAVAYQARTIRVPVHMVDQLREMYKSTREIEQALGRLPNVEELADHMRVEISKVRWMQQVAQEPISLERPIDEEGSEFGALIEDESAQSPAQVAYQNMLRERIEDVLSTLSPREARILRLRFGLGEERPYTLEEVGQQFRVTRERIRQVEAKAIRKLRRPRTCKSLHSLLDASTV